MSGYCFDPPPIQLERGIMGNAIVGAGMRLGLAVALMLGSLEATAESTNPTFPTLEPGAPAGTGQLASCELGVEGTVRCGVLRVHEDRDTRTGTVDVHFIVLDALDRAAGNDDAITFFSGGPGADVTAGADSFAQDAASFRQSRDILLVDFRGTGRSGALRCDVPYPGGLESRFGTVFPVDHIAGCAARLAARADLTWYRTDPTIDDLEQIRRWLGYSALNLIGSSYGSREAQVYMRRYPGAVRTAILNGLVPVGRPSYLYTAPSLQGAIEAVFADCRADDACRAAYPGIEARLDEVIERLDCDPPTVEVKGTEVILGRGDFAYALRGLLYGRSSEIPYWIDRAWRGEWQELAKYYLERTDWVAGDFAAGYHFSTLCAEDVNRITPQQIEAASEGTFESGHLIRGYRDACRVWPAAPVPDGFDRPVRSDIPTLLLSGSRDPVTPPRFADEVAEGLPNSLRVVVPGAGHGVAGRCVETLQLQLVESGSVEGLDPSCVEAVPSPSFRLPDEDRGA
jgi:pimeloyl-ACP methyl ester carboxylesterase